MDKKKPLSGLRFSFNLLDKIAGAVGVFALAKLIVGHEVPRSPPIVADGVETEITIPIKDKIHRGLIFIGLIAENGTQPAEADQAEFLSGENHPLGTLRILVNTTGANRELGSGSCHLVVSLVGVGVA